MKELKPVQIFPYMPELKVCQRNKIYAINGIFKENYETHRGELIGFIFSKPILRSLDLIKPIIVGGVEMIPLIELAKIAFPQLNWKLVNGLCKAISEGVTLPREHYFSFEESSFEYIHEESRAYFGTVPNQLTLFKWLYANKFNLDIDWELALDADKIPGGNPYNS